MSIAASDQRVASLRGALERQGEFLRRTSTPTNGTSASTPASDRTAPPATPDPFEAVNGEASLRVVPGTAGLRLTLTLSLPAVEAADLDELLADQRSIVADELRDQYAEPLLRLHRLRLEGTRLLRERARVARELATAQAERVEVEATLPPDMATRLVELGHRIASLEAEGAALAEQAGEVNRLEIAASVALALITTEYIAPVRMALLTMLTRLRDREAAAALACIGDPAKMANHVTQAARWNSALANLPNEKAIEQRLDLHALVRELGASLAAEPEAPAVVVEAVEGSESPAELFAEVEEPHRTRSRKRD